ncbi:MAG: hypothetical protein ABIH48_01610 [Candidatus Falkowbacteria bacterium]
MTKSNEMTKKDMQLILFMKQLKNQAGNALLLTILMTSLIFSLGMYFLSITLTENKISYSHAQAMRGYYLAEAGLAEAIFKLKNDETYSSEFETNPDWSATFSRDNFFYDNSSYTVTIQNTSEAHADITVTGANNTTQRVTKAGVYKATGGGYISGGEGGNALLVDHRAFFNASSPSIYDGSVHSNNLVKVQALSNVYIEKNLTAVGNVNVQWLSNLTVNGEIRANNYQPAAESVGMPTVSFDDPDDPNALKNRADVIYTEDEFEDLIEAANPTLTLNNAITYVTGDIEFGGDKELVINNGILVADGDIILGEGSWSQCLMGNGDDFVLTITQGEETSSGLISKDDITFEDCVKEININGVIYAGDTITMNSSKNDFNVAGNIVAREFWTISIWSPITITLSSQVLDPAFTSPIEFSPVISVEHWEEEY